ncbi:hypothetical protein [Longitalea arenae]|nr:hypothetical protein [Longitalea arenae]
MEDSTLVFGIAMEACKNIKNPSGISLFEAAYFLATSAYQKIV